MLMSSGDQLATLLYESSSFRVMKAGRHVACAVSGELIALEDLRYWSAEHQEAYANAEFATQRLLRGA